MPENNATKIKLLKLYELLRTETDEARPLTKTQICQRMAELGVPLNPRTIERDVKALGVFGFEVITYIKDREKYYYVPEREFSVPELKILMDAVQAASFITEKKTKELIDKIAALGGSFRADLLKRNMVCFNTRKHSNESILYTVDQIEEAIQKKKKVSFYYFYLDEKKERVYQRKKSGEKTRYYVEPIAMVMNEDNYYLMTYSTRYPDKTTSYRLDRMDQVEVVEDSELSEAAIEKIAGVAEYTEQAFKMYSGEPEEVTIRFDRTLIGPVIDKFGEDISMAAVDDTTIEAMVAVQVSPTFFGWIAQFSDKMIIKEPITIRKTYMENLMKSFKQEQNDG